MECTVAVDYPCETGESPLWDGERGRLYWIDIYGGLVLWYAPASDDHGVAYAGGTLGGLTLQRDGSLLLFGEAGRVVRLAGDERTTVVDSVQRDDHTRYNDCIADPRGRVFCGTKGTEEGPGRLYRLDTDGSLTLVVDDLGLSNGMGFTPDRAGFYHTDSTAGRIYRFDYDESTGELANREVFVDASGEAGMPDGLTVDADGHVWSARYGAGCIVQYAPSGAELWRLEVPVDRPTSVAFGGEGLTDLYVTTAGGADPDAAADAGALFRVDLDVRGVEPHRSAVA